MVLSNSGRLRSEQVGIRDPVNAAIDVVTWNFWPSPFQKQEEAEPGEQPVIFKTSSGKTRTECPVMASGFKESHERGYKFATQTKMKFIGRRVQTS